MPIPNNFEKTLESHTEIVKFLTHLLNFKPIGIATSDIVGAEKAVNELSQTNYKLMVKVNELEQIINGMLRKVPGVMLANALHEVGKRM